MAEAIGGRGDIATADSVGASGSRGVSGRSPSQLFISEHNFKVGDRVALVSDPETFGTIQFIGPTDFASGEWVGVGLDEAKGKNDGSVQGTRYFECEASKGLFLRPNALVPAGETASLQRRLSSAGDAAVSGLKSERNSLSSPTRKASLPTNANLSSSLDRSPETTLSPESPLPLGSYPSPSGASDGKSTEALSNLLSELRNELREGRAESQQEWRKIGADLTSLKATIASGNRASVPSTAAAASPDASADAKFTAFQAQLKEHRSAVESMLDQKLSSMSQLKAAGDSPLILAAIGRVLEKVSGKPADLDLSPILEDNAVMKKAISERPLVDLSPVLMAIDDIKVSVPDREELEALKSSLDELKSGAARGGAAQGGDEDIASALQALREARLELQASLDADRYKVRTSLSLPPEQFPGLGAEAAPAAASTSSAAASTAVGDLQTVLNQLGETRAKLSESLGQICQDIDDMKRVQAEELPQLKRKMSALVESQATLQTLTEGMRTMSSIDDLRKKPRSKAVSFEEECPMTFAPSEGGAVVATKSSMRSRKVRDVGVELDDVLDAIEEFKDAAVEAVSSLTIDVDLEPVLDAIKNHRAGLDDASIELLKGCLNSDPSSRPASPDLTEMQKPVLAAIQELSRGIYFMQQQLQGAPQCQPLPGALPDVQQLPQSQAPTPAPPQLLAQETRLPQEDVDTSSPSSSACPPAAAAAADGGGAQSESELRLQLESPAQPQQQFQQQFQAPTAMAISTAPASATVDDASVARLSEAVARAAEEQVNKSIAALRADLLVVAANQQSAYGQATVPVVASTRPDDWDSKLEQRMASAVAAGLSAEAMAIRERDAALWQRECRSNAASAVADCLGTIGEQLRATSEQASSLQQQLQQSSELSLQQQQLQQELQQEREGQADAAVEQREIAEETKKMAGSLEDLAGMVEVMALAITDLKNEVQVLGSREDAVDLSPVLEAIRHQRLQIDEAALSTLRGDAGGSSQQLLVNMAEDVAAVKSWVEVSKSSVAVESQERLCNPTLSLHRAEEFQAVLLSKFSDLRADMDQVRLSTKAASSTREPDMEPVLEALRKHRSEMAVSMGVLLSEKRIAQGLTAIKETVSESVRQSIQQDLYGVMSPPPTISSAMPAPYQASCAAPAAVGSSAKRSSKSQPPPPSSFSQSPAEPAYLEGGMRYAVQGSVEPSAGLAHTTGPSTSRKSVPKLRKRPSQQSQSSDSTIAGPVAVGGAVGGLGGGGVGRRYTEEAREIIKAFDTNGDGMISKSEFKEAMRRRALSPGPQ